jgi:hypothetical protein
LGAAAIAFVWAMAWLTHRLAADSNPPAVLTARISGAIFAALILAAAAAFMTAAGSLTFGDVFDDEGQFESGISALPQLGYLLVNVGGTLAASSTIVAVSLLMEGDSRSEMLVRRAGYIAALLLPLSVIITPVLVLLPLWTVAVSVVIARTASAA